MELKNLDLINILLKGNVDVNIKDEEGKTIYHHAILLNETNVFNILKEYEHKINFKVQDKDGNTLLHLAV